MHVDRSAGILMAMTSQIDLTELAREIAEIARTTLDPATAARLLELADRLLTAAGLPDDGKASGGDLPPSDWRHSASVDCPEYA
jgi:hypothetical protein